MRPQSDFCVRKNPSVGFLRSQKSERLLRFSVISDLTREGRWGGASLTGKRPRPPYGGRANLQKSDGGRARNWVGFGLPRPWRDGGLPRPWRDGGLPRPWRDGGLPRPWRDGSAGVPHGLAPLPPTGGGPITTPREGRHPHGSDSASEPRLPTSEASSLALEGTLTGPFDPVRGAPYP